MPPADSPPPPPLPPNRKPWQFSLRSMMIGTTGFALLCGFATVLPTAFSQTLIGTIWVAATGWLVTGLFFAKGDQRAFCIGAMIAVSSTWSRIAGRLLQGVFGIFDLLLGGFDMSRGMHLWLGNAMIAVIAVANGYLCIYARRYFERHAND